MTISQPKAMTHETKLCYNGFFQLKQHTIQHNKFDGSQSKPHQREVLIRKPTVAMLMFDPKHNTVLLTEQFRIGPLENDSNPWLFELPAGIVEKNEDKHHAIEREVLEETGYICTAEQMIGEFYLSPGGSNETTTLFFSRLTLLDSGIHGEQTENEDIKTHIMSIDHACQLMQQGRLSVITALALMWLKNQEVK
ncbi:MAG: NUDIX domain-containing protein [Methylococcales bacterium]|nr:NUDIX domain-containing protein [Methylococcales bacterium]